MNNIVNVSNLPTVELNRWKYFTKQLVLDRSAITSSIPNVSSSSSSSSSDGFIDRLRLYRQIISSIECLPNYLTDKELLEIHRITKQRIDEIMIVINNNSTNSQYQSNEQETVSINKDSTDDFDQSSAELQQDTDFIATKKKVTIKMSVGARVVSTNDGDDQQVSSADRLQSLLLQQKDMHAQEIDNERKQHDMLTSELAELTAVLMEASKHMNNTVLEQNLKLDAIQDHAIQNKEELDSQKKKMSEREGAMTGTMWGTIGTMIWIVTWFIITYVVIRLFPKPA